MSLFHAYRRGQAAAREDLTWRKEAPLAEVLLNDLRRAAGGLLNTVTGRRSPEKLAGDLGRLREELREGRELWERWQAWQEWRAQPLVPVQTREWFYDFKGHRIGDKVVSSALFQYLRLCQPNARLVLIDDQLDDRAGRTLPTGPLFGDLADEIWRVAEPGDRARFAQRIADEQLQPLAWTRDLRPATLAPGEGCCNGHSACPGLPWLMLPRLARLGIYPKLRVPHAPLPEQVERQLAKAADRPWLVFHILSDAPYNPIRNQDFACYEGLVDHLQRAAPQLYLLRVGLPGSRRLNLSPEVGLDLSHAHLSLLQIAALQGRAKMFLGGDTGLSHLAGALGVPRLISIYAYMYGLEYTLRHCFSCVRHSGLAEPMSCFPSLPKQRLCRVRQRAHRFDPELVARDVCEQLSSLQEGA